MLTRVLPDANVLYSRTLRDWLFMLRLQGNMYTVVTTEDILAEVVTVYRRNKPGADGGAVRRLVETIRRTVDEVLEEYIVDPNYAGSDPKDAHVHAAAITENVDVLLTQDKVLLGLADDRYEASNPDEFFCLADDSQPALTRQVALWYQQQHRPGKNGLGGHLKSSGCPDFARRADQRLAEALRAPVGTPTRIVVPGRKS